MAPRLLEPPGRRPTRGRLLVLKWRQARPASSGGAPSCRHLRRLSAGMRACGDLRALPAPWCDATSTLPPRPMHVATGNGGRYGWADFLRQGRPFDAAKGDFRRSALSDGLFRQISYAPMPHSIFSTGNMRSMARERSARWAGRPAWLHSSGAATPRCFTQGSVGGRRDFDSEGMRSPSVSRRAARNPRPRAGARLCADPRPRGRSRTGSSMPSPTIEASASVWAARRNAAASLNRARLLAHIAFRKCRYNGRWRISCRVLAVYGLSGRATEFRMILSRRPSGKDVTSLAGTAGLLGAALAPRLALANMPTPFTYDLAPPMDSREKFIAWGVEQRGEDPKYLGRTFSTVSARWCATRIFGDDPNKHAFLLTPREKFVRPQKSVARL